MSLIGEALKKAHLEAVRQDGSRSGVVHTPGVAQYHRPHRPDRRLWTTALIVSNVLLALLVAAAVIWKTGGSAETATAATIPADRPPATRTASTTAAETQLDPAVDSPQNIVVPSPMQRAAVSTPEPARMDLPVAAKPEQSAPATAAEVPPSPPRALTAVDGLVAGQTYMRSVPTPGGTELVLSGMSVAGGRGVALINSRMVREGDRVGPFQVGPIADRRVALDYKGITVYLKMP